MEVERKVLRNGVNVDEETSLFQLFFLREDKNQSVDVEEVEKIDFRRVKERLERGESVFIKRVRKQLFSTTFPAREETTKPWYFTHE
jgi:hypothetical protein